MLTHSTPGINFEDNSASNGNDFAIQVNGNAFKIVDTDNSNRVGFQFGSDGNTSLGGNVTINGSIFLNTHLDMGDSDVIKLGDGDDLQIYHDGSHSYIQDVGTGKLRLTTNSFRLLETDNSTAMIAADQDGAVYLYHNGSLRFETESNGATLTGARLKVQNSGDTDFNLRDTSTNAVSAYIGAKSAGRVEYNCYKEGVGTKYPHVFVGYTEEYARIDTNGIKFNGDTAAANALSDYEEGTWTPAISGVSYNDAQGTYIKIGTTCFVTLSINQSNTSKSGDTRITGLPFTPKTGSGEYYPANSIPFFEVSGISLSSGYNNIYGRIDYQQSNLQLLVTDGESHGILTAGSGTTLNSNHSLRTSFTYQTA